MEPRAGFEPATYSSLLISYKAVAEADLSLAAEPPGLFISSRSARSFKSLVLGARLELISRASTTVEILRKQEA